jgi:hypothetical protein
VAVDNRRPASDATLDTVALRLRVRSWLRRAASSADRKGATMTTIVIPEELLPPLRDGLLFDL